MRLHAPLQGPRTRVLDRNVYSRLEDMKNVPEGLASAGNGERHIAQHLQGNLKATFYVKTYFYSLLFLNI